MPTLGPFDVHPLCLGGNVFGASADAPTSEAVLDAYVAAGGNFIDTADTYGAGTSESVLGDWLAARNGVRDQVVIGTKVANKKDRRGLSAANIALAADESLKRLQTDHIDLYLAHGDDPSVPLEESLGAFDALVQAGKVRAIGLSNFTADRVRETVAVARREGLTVPVALQPNYSLVDRDAYEGPLRDAATETGLAVTPYFGLAAGFLTGKYRPGGDIPEGWRTAYASKYLDTTRGPRILEVLDDVAAAHRVVPGAVALAWLRVQPTVVSALASARTVEQLDELLPFATLELSPAEREQLDAASES